MLKYNGTYTVTSFTGEHRTFMIKTQPDDARFAPASRIISMLVGSDNENDYKGFGFVYDNEIYVWPKKRAAKHQEPTFWEKSADMVWSLVTKGDASPYYRKGCRLMVEERCRRCNRKLTNPVSIEAGIGPECAQRG